MSRQIKFRGMRVDGKGWAEGSYHFSYLEEMHCISFVNNLDDDDWHFVKGKTVGQFTGLLDKSGKEIFEGDIIDYPSEMIRECPESESNQVIDGHFYKTIPNKTGAIIFNAPSFCVKNGCNLGSRGLKKEGIEIIGDIHTTPELLK